MISSRILGGILLIGLGGGQAVAQTPALGNAARLGHAPFARGALPSDRTMSVDPRVGRSHGHTRHHDRRFHGHRLGIGLGLWGYGGGYVYTEPARDMFGFFGAGGDVKLIGGEASYDYDRGYPYDRFEEPRVIRGNSTPYVSSGYRCETSWVPGDSGSQTVPVRICRR